MRIGRTTFAPLPAVTMAALLTMAWTAGGVRADALSDGKKALKDGNAEQAIPLLRQAVKEDANRPEAQIALGQALEKRRRFDEAVTAYQAAAKLDPRSAEAQRGLGVSLVHQGKVEEGAKALQAAIDLDRKFPEAALALGDALVQLKRYDDAVNVLTDGTKWGPKIAPYFYEGLGRAEAARGKVKESEVYLLKAREMMPNVARFHRALGDLYMQRKIPNLATLSYQQAIDLDPNDLDSRFAMARALARDSRFNDALDQYKAIIERDSLYSEAYKEMGDIYVRAADTNPGFLGDALRNLENYRRLEPNDPEGGALLARAYYRMGKKDEALALLTPTATAGKLTPDGHLVYGRLLYEKQDWQGAVRELSAARTKMDEVDVRRLAQSLGKTGNVLAADTLFASRWAADSLAGKTDSKSSDWVLERGKLRYGMGKTDSTQYDAAIPFFQRKTELDPKSDEAYYYWGLSLRERKRFAAADSVLSKAVELAPNKADRHFWHAVTLLDLGRQPEARQELETVTRLDSTTSLGAISRQRQGYYLLLEKKWPEAVELLEASVRIDPKQAQSWVWLGQGYQNSGQKQKAIEAYHKALEINPNQQDAKKGLQQLSTP